ARSDRFAHMAPEQLASAEPIDHRADIFALGTVMWSLLTGRPLFRRSDAVSTMHQVLHMPVPRPSCVGRHPPPWLDDICLSALHRSAVRRPGSAEQLARALKQAAHNEGWASRAEITEWVRRAVPERSPVQADRMSLGASSMPVVLTAWSEGSLSSS